MSEQRDYITQEDENGRIEISNDVIAIIAAEAALEVEGIGGLAGGIGSDIAELLGKKNLSKGIKIQTEEAEITVEAHVLVKYGYVVTDVARNIQDSITNAIEAMTGMTVSTVNVHIAGIAFEKNAN